MLFKACLSKNIFESPLARSLFEKNTYCFAEAGPGLGERISTARNIKLRRVGDIRPVFPPDLHSEGDVRVNSLSFSTHFRHATFGF